MITLTKPDFREEYAKTSGIITEISDADVKKARDWSIAVAEAKAEEEHHKTDPRKTAERFFTGMLGEIAIAYIIKQDAIDWSIGKSAAYKKADLSPIDINVGIKTVRHPDGNRNIEAFPLVSQTPKSPEIINIKLSDNRIDTIGLVDEKHLKTDVRIDLVNDEYAKKRKTGFWNLSATKPFKSLDELKSLVFSDYWPIDWS